MESILVIVLRKLIGLSIQLKRPAPDTVGYPSHRSAKIQRSRLIALHIIITKNHINQIAIPVRNQNLTSTAP